MNKKLQVFISSTFLDLKDERQEAVNAVLDAGHIPIGMELFKSGKPTIEVIKEWVDKSDVYLLILGGRYGSLGAPDEKGYTEFEYDYACSKGKPIILIALADCFLKYKTDVLKEENVYEEENKDKYDFFYHRVTINVNKFVHNLDQIKSAILSELSAIANDDIGKRSSPLVGYIHNPIRTFSTIEEVDSYVGEAIKNAESSVFDLTWKNLYKNDPMRNNSQYTESQAQFLDIIKQKLNEKVQYRHIFTFPPNKKERINRVIELAPYDSYECGFFDSYTRNFPKLHFLIIDNKEVIFASSDYKNNLCAIKDPELVGILTTYYGECWDMCTKIKDRSSSNKDFTQKRIQEACDDFEQRKKVFRFLKHLLDYRKNEHVRFC